MLLAEASEVGRGLPRYVDQDFARYLERGVLAHGFTRVRARPLHQPGALLGRSLLAALLGPALRVLGPLCGQGPSFLQAQVKSDTPTGGNGYRENSISSSAVWLRPSLRGC
jgi:hypothetical protein